MGIGLQPTWLVIRGAGRGQHVVPAGRSLLGGRQSLWVHRAMVTEQAAPCGTLVGLSLYAVCLGWLSTEVPCAHPALRCPVLTMQAHLQLLEAEGAERGGERLDGAGRLIRPCMAF